MTGQSVRFWNFIAHPLWYLSSNMTHGSSNKTTSFRPSYTVCLLGTKYVNKWACVGCTHPNHYKNEQSHVRKSSRETPNSSAQYQSLQTSNIIFCVPKDIDSTITSTVLPAQSTASLLGREWHYSRFSVLFGRYPMVLCVSNILWP